MFEVRPVARVKCERKTPEDDFWGEKISVITFADNVPAEALAGIESFSHLEIIFIFDQVKTEDIVWYSHPRGNKSYPLTGIFAQRKKDRPNRLGLTTVELVRTEGRRIFVKNLDATEGTPVLDIKPVFREFEPAGDIRQPLWVSELMKNYFTVKKIINEQS